MKEIIEFLKNDIRGLIILAIVSSLIAALLYDSLKKLYNNLLLRYRKNKINKLMDQIRSNYTDGFTAGYANNSSYHQITLTGKHLISIIIQCSIILFSTIVFVASLLLIGQPFSYIIVIVFSVILTFQYRKLRDYRNNYQRFFEGVFGEEFFEKAKKKSMEHINVIVKQEVEQE